jgi:hypothetical protein
MDSNPNATDDPGNTSSQPPTVKKVGMFDPTPLSEAHFWKKGNFDSNFRDQHQGFPRGNSSSSAANDDTIVSFIFSYFFLLLMMRKVKGWNLQ